MIQYYETTDQNHASSETNLFDFLSGTLVSHA